ncbi:hypothetical protein V1282_005386 [Nitrobacteraceae bacterium AZCC 2146]
MKFLEHARQLRQEADRLRSSGLHSEADRRDRQAEVYETIELRSENYEEAISPGLKARGVSLDQSKTH